jgi:hypothetical protein
MPEVLGYVEQLSESQLAAVYDLAMVPYAWRADLKTIAWCESYWKPRAVGDSGNSLGLHQIWFGWFRADENPFDPVTNTMVAVRIRETRGRFGGGGGWSCATALGIE